jgi:hypothetical protein
MRSFYFKNSSNNAQKNEIIRVAKSEMQRRTACKQVVAGTLVNVNVLIPLQTHPHAHTPPDTNVNISKPKHRTRVKPSLAKVKSVSRTQMQER